MYSTFFIFWYCYCWTVKSDGDCQLIPPVHKVSFLSFFLVSGLAMLCHFMVSYHPCPQRSRETGTVFQSLKLIQTVSNSCWNFSNMFVAELVVIASVNHSIGHSLEGLLTYSCSQGVKHWVVSSVSWVCMLNKSIALEWLVPVLDSLCPGCRSILDHWFLADISDHNHWQGDYYPYWFIIAQKPWTIFNFILNCI